MKKLHVPALKEALVRALGLRGDVRLDLDGTIVPVMIAGTTLEVELATQVRVVNDLSDPAGVEIAQPVRVSTGEVDVNIVDADGTAQLGVLVENTQPIRVELTEAIHVQVYEDKSPYFRFRNFDLGTMKDDSDHYMTVGRWDDDDDDSRYFVYERLIIRSTDNDEDWDKWEFVTFTGPTPTSANYTRQRFRSRFGDLTSGDHNPALRHKEDDQLPGAVGGVIAKVRDVGGEFEEIDDPSDSLGRFELGGLGITAGYNADNVWGVGLRRLRRQTPDIQIMVAGYWLPR